MEITVQKTPSLCLGAITLARKNYQKKSHLDLL